MHHRAVFPASGGSFTVLDWTLTTGSRWCGAYLHHRQRAAAGRCRNRRVDPARARPEDKGPFSVTAAQVAPDARSIYYLSDHGGEYRAASP
jgi:hypothetical protein